MRSSILMALLGLLATQANAGQRCVEEQTAKNSFANVILVSNFGFPVRNSCEQNQAQVAPMATIAAPAASAKTESLEHNLANFLADSKAQINGQDGTWFNFDSVSFESGSAQLSKSSAQQLANVAAIMKEHRTAKFKIGGYTDSVGAETFNKKLSQQRAQAVIKELKALGISDAQLAGAEGYGSSHPVASNDSAEGRARNRRMAVKVVTK